jgi:hypothetical protein
MWASISFPVLTLLVEAGVIGVEGRFFRLEAVKDIKQGVVGCRLGD